MSSIIGQHPGMSRPGSRLESRFDSRFETRPSSRPSSRASVRPSSIAGVPTHVCDAEPSRARPQSRQSLPGPGSGSPGSGKRKRDARHVPAVAADGLLKASVVLKPHPSRLTVKPRILHPLMLLPRENLPLSALDLSQPHGDFPSSRLFESKIKILDLEGRLGSNVLIARSETTRMVYAVERESNGLYVLCKLGPWVDVETLSQSATVVCRERTREAKSVKLANPAAAPLTTPAMYNESKRRKLAIEEIQSLVRKRSLSMIEKEPPSKASTSTEERPASREDVGENTNPVQATTEAPAASGPSGSGAHGAPTPEPAPSDDPLSPPNADEIFQNTRAQYMEALYHSRGSLAYFAKGPLSRARAAFHMDWDSDLDMNDLVEFLKSLVMTTVVIDKKYRETIPEIVAKMKTLVQESETGASKPKKRKPKKPKLGKDGLYPGEVDHIKRWWTSRQPVSSADDEKTLTTTEHKYHISCLRRRETQLQMILILEILALEPLALAKGTECQLPGMESQVASREVSQEPSTRKRNKHNLPVLLDVHADRLCIWQSTTLDEVKAVAESQLPTEGHEGETPERANSDPLRDFCVDIVVPFFSARLPGPCDSLNRKLGGPIAQSPPKEKAAKPASAVKPRPGAPMKRPTALKRDKDRTLERALSVERSRRSVSRGPAATIALLRSATQTVIPGLKREASDSSLMGLIPRAEAGSLKERPSNIFSRSVSLSGTDFRAQKKAQVDAELKDAISALKKPNRTLAVKDFVDAAEKRASSAGQLKKMKKPNRASAVHIKATPANNRYKDALAAEKAQSQPTPFLNLPPSSASVVPGSTLPRKFANRLANQSAPPAYIVQATPAHPTSSSIPATGLRPVHETPGPGLPPSSPIMARKAAPAPAPPLFARSKHLPVPAAGRFGADDLPSSPGLGILFETPVAPRSARERFNVVDDTPIRSRLPLGVAGDGGNRSVAGGGGGGAVKKVVGGVKETRLGSERSGGGGSDGAGGLEENGGGLDMDIYQRLGWDTTDLDDIDDLL
ncbi:DNA replication regulator SLD3-domain-containing protein [Chaetomidium leptoderma]|uniref:DNA replication regulator SLD3-domain-containing protein n=1 Tax=Chaetomidium leptoderma TaxID=669021 RepID=A0AAN6VNQ6_9PEZI|nr:DNA replication regulator SLD3-domain-containing protein [Chaetomidium leptoderma]